MGDLNFVRKSKFQAFSLFHKPQETPEHKGMILLYTIVFAEVHLTASLHCTQCCRQPNLSGSYICSIPIRVFVCFFSYIIPIGVLVVKRQNNFF